MVFRVRIIDSNGPVKDTPVYLSEGIWDTRNTLMQHIGNGWYECSSNAIIVTILVKRLEFQQHHSSVKIVELRHCYNGDILFLG